MADFWWGFTHPGEAVRWLAGDAMRWMEARRRATASKTLTAESTVQV